MVAIRSFAAAEAQTSDALAALDRQLSDAGGDAHFVYAFYGCDHDGAALLDFLKQRFPDADPLGGASCSGAMSESRLWGAESIGSLPGGPESLAGGLMVYCAGCMLAVDSRMPEVASKVAEAFSGTPFLGCFTFGEQGCVVERNVHGNLMISAIAFGR
jgi:hypothetical protein